MRANISDIIIKFMNEKSYKKMERGEILKIFAGSKAERKSLELILDTLEEDGIIIRDSKNRYATAEKSGYEKGIIRLNSKGFGFISSENHKTDIFIPKDFTGFAMDKDEVLFKVVKGETEGAKSEGIVKMVLKRHTNVIVGRFSESKSFGFVIPNDRKMIYDLFIPKKMFNQAKEGDIVVAKILKYPSLNKKPEGMITEIVGDERSLDVDIKSELLQREIKEEFNVRVIKQVELLPDKIQPNDRKGRKQFNDQYIYTIDGVDAKDLDDAISVKKTEKGLYQLGVYIADVSHYVPEKTPLDKEALARGTSLYFANRVIPMLPPKISNGLCSLNPNEEKLVLAVIMYFNDAGKLVDSEIHEGIISSDKRLNYDEVSDFMENNQLSDNLADSAILQESLKLAEELSRLIRKNRNKRGSLDFDFPESYFEIEGEKILGVKQREIRTANKIIEDFMIATNEVIAETFYMQEIPFLYREHEAPDPEKLSVIYRQLERYNIFPKTRADKKIYPSDIQDIMNKIEDLPEKDVLNHSILRAMQKARYSPDNSEHFGLASKYYSHFTAPIRRYPDLQIHRIIKENLNGKLTGKRIDHYEKILYDVAQQSSEMEVRADDLERTVDDILSCYYMQDHIGEEFDGKITGITNFGLYITLSNSIEGLIRYSDLTDDYYQFDSENMYAIGDDSQKIFKFGDEVRTIVDKVDFDFREIRLSLV